jgi:putative endonuclease
LCHVGQGAAPHQAERGGARDEREDEGGGEGECGGRGDNFSTRARSNAGTRAGECRTRREIGARFEQHALVYLQRQRLVLVARNVHCRGGELDLVMRDRDGTLVFVEVRARARRGYGGAAASVGWHKRQRLLLAARDFLAARAQALEAMPGACRFDLVTFEGGRLTWLRDAFRADDE